MKIPFGDLKTHYNSIKEDIDTAVNRVLESGYYILGPELTAFESAFSDYLGVNYAVGCASGTEAIYLALAAAGVGPESEVIVPSHTAVPTISAISMTGARPVFADIDRDTYLMDVSKLEKLITARTSALLPVHLYGQMVDMDSLMALAEKHNLPVIEDVAQATGATYKGKKAGTIGRFGAFSFYPSKNLGAFGDGGCVVGRDALDYEALKRLRNYGQSVRYHHDTIGINSRLDEMQAAILSAQLPYLNNWNERRRAIAARYTRGLADLVETPREADWGRHVYHLYVIRTENREQFQNFMTDRGIQTLIHYPVPAHLQKAYSYLGYKKGSLPESEYIADRIVSLPMHPWLTDSQVDLIIETIREFTCTQENRSAVSNPATQQRSVTRG